MTQRKGGFIRVQVNSTLYDAKGDATYNLGNPKRDAILGARKVHGFTEKVQVPFLEIKFTDNAGLDLNALQNLEDATVTLELANGKVVVWREAWYASEGNANSAEGEIDARFESVSAEEI